MLRLNGGGGEKMFFHNKRLGTRVGDRLGKGKYFPQKLWTHKLGGAG